MTNPISIVVLLIAAAACVTDLRTRRIPNVLTFGAAAAALVYHTVTGGSGGALHAAAGWGIGAGIFLLVFVLGGLGAGDVKLLGALGAWLGPTGAFWLAIYTALAGGALALVVGLAGGYLRQALANIWLLVTHWFFFAEATAPFPGVDKATVALRRGDSLGTMVTLAPLRFVLRLLRRSETGAELVEFAISFPAAAGRARHHRFRVAVSTAR
jgi:prepilin peptidase CpaA